MIKKVSFLMVSIIVLFTIPCFLTTGVDYNHEADLLKSYGLFSGTNNGYELERVPNRVEAAAMLVKLLGKEDEAKTNHYAHPFKDVPSWANDAVGYMYVNKMSTGIGSNMFGSSQPMKAKDFTVFALKALGYTDADFTYSDAMVFAEKVELYDANTRSELERVEFKRDELVHICFNAINTNLKGSDQTLFDKLSAEGVIKKVVDNSASSTTDAFLAGKTTRYEKTIKNINTSGETLTIDTDVVKFKFTKKYGHLYEAYLSEVIKVSENFIQNQIEGEDGYYYEGNRVFPKTFTQWGDSIIYYNLAFYKNGTYQLSVDFASITTQGYSTYFEMPATNFDQIILTAYPVNNAFLGTTPDDFVKIYNQSDVNDIMSLIRSGTGIRRINTGINASYSQSVESLKSFWMTYVYGGVHYPNGKYFRIGESKYNLPESTLPYEVSFTTEFSSSTSVFKINREKYIKPISVNYALNTSDIKDKLTIYCIYGEGFKIKNLLIITK